MNNIKFCCSLWQHNKTRETIICAEDFGSAQDSLLRSLFLPKINRKGHLRSSSSENTADKSSYDIDSIGVTQHFINHFINFINQFSFKPIRTVSTDFNKISVLNRLIKYSRTPSS